MADSRLAPSPRLVRLLSATVAGVAALAVIALGVRIGTTALAFSDERAAATATARPASALVDLIERPAGGLDLAATLVALLPPGVLDPASAGGGQKEAPAGPQRAGASTPAEPPAARPDLPAPSDLVPSGPVPAPPVTLPPAPVVPAPEAISNPLVQTIQDVKRILGL